MFGEFPQPQGKNRANIKNIPCENVTVTTFSYNKYAFDPTEHDHLCSAEVIKAKFKMAEDVLEHLCLDYEKRL